MRRHLIALGSLAFLLLTAGPPAAAQTLLLRQPTVSARQIAFSYANNIWIVDRAGGTAQRLTSFQGQETNPKLSPNGRWVAFSGQYGGNTDVYIVSSEGGEPTRLTWHTAPDLVQGWSPDGRRVVFTSTRAAAPSGTAVNFWSVSTEAGLPAPLPMHRGWQGKYSPDGSRFAYRLATSWDDERRNYRGGQNKPIWIVNLPGLDLETVPWEGSKDIDPVWVGETVYFASDRDWVSNVWSYNTRTKAVAQVTTFTDFDVKALDAGGGAVVFEQGGRIHLLDPATGRSAPVNITVRGDFPWLMPTWQPVQNRIVNAALSPTGKRAVFEARGEIFTVPADKGDWRNLSNSATSAERNPAWSPDGKWISWFTDASGEYQLVIAPQDGLGDRRTIRLPDPSFQYTPSWSPDSKKLLFTDTGLKLWVVDVESGRVTQADTDTYMAPARTLDPVWSPDSRWIAYAKRLPSQYHAVHVYNMQDGGIHQVTDGLSDAMSPAWDASGKYLWFLASTNFALNTGWLDMTSYDRPVTRAVYLAVLSRTEASPLAPESDEEGRGAAPDSSARPGRGTPAAPTVSIDFDGLTSRILSVNVTPRNYSNLLAGPAGTVFFLENLPATGVGDSPPPANALHRYQMKDREAKSFLPNVQTYTLSADGKKLLYRTPGQNGSWTIVDADKAPPPSQGTAGRLNLASLRMRVDPTVEYPQMFAEGWRIQRDYLYVPNAHGSDWPRMKTMYQPFLAHVRHRADFNYLMDMMGGELAIGHSYVRGGDFPDIPTTNVGYLGADYSITNDRYRIAKIYTGESWNPQLQAPLSGPGLNVAVGDYVMAIDGVPLAGTDNIHQVMEGRTGRQTVLTLNAQPSLTGARQVTVVPVGNEGGLRQFDWIESNRRKVDSLSNGRLAYIYVPNTGQPGYTYFNRYFFAQQHKLGAIIDERYNGGGSAADYMVEVMNRKLLGYFNNAVGERQPFTTPGAGIWGPKVMIINEMAGSGGDLLPHMFRTLGIGPIVGQRTWGGLVGTWDTPPFIDGGSMIAPRGGFYDLEGKWAVENEGVPADIEVENTPKEVAAGHDPQLERAVQEALRLLQQNPVVLKPEPPPPTHGRRKKPGDR